MCVCEKGSAKGEGQKEGKEIETGFPAFYFHRTILKRYSGVRKGFLLKKNPLFCRDLQMVIGL